MADDPVLTAYYTQVVDRLRAESPVHAFTLEEYARRLSRLKSSMVEDGIDVVLVTNPDAIAWLHGYCSRWYRHEGTTTWPPIQLTAVHVDGDRLFHVDSIWHEDLIRATSVAEDVRLVAARGLEDWLAFVVGELRANRWLGGVCGLENWSSVPNPAVSKALSDALVAAGCRVVDATRTVRAVRRVKSAAEIAVIEEAARVCDVGLDALLHALRPGATELEAWGTMMAAMAAAGGEHGAIHENVVVGPDQVIHKLSSRRVMREGDYVLADPCGVVHRYHANAARTFCLGPPAPEAIRIAEIEAGAYDVLLSTARVGLPVRDLNRALRSYYQDAGVWGLRSWMGGYELGLSLPPEWVGEWVFSVEDEDPDGVIEAGTVTNYESRVLFPMIDTVVYEEAGPRVLSHTPREILAVA